MSERSNKTGKKKSVTYKLPDVKADGVEVSYRRHEPSKSEKHDHDEEHDHEFSVRDCLITALAVVLFITAIFLPTSGWLRLITFIVPYLIAGYGVLIEAAEKIIAGELLDEDFLMSIASIGAFCIGEYPEAAAVMIFYRIGELFESYAVGKSRRSIAELMEIRPDYANIESENGIVKVSPETVEVGTVILIQPGERIPLDGEIIDGITSLDTASLTGESLPRTVGIGDRVLSGCINLTAPIYVEVKASYGESTASRILDLVEHSSENKSQQEGFIRRFSRIYTPVVVSLAVILAVIPPLFNHEWISWIRRALIFLVVSCPCALVISVPLAYFGGIGSAARAGILIKGSNYLEALSKVKTMVFDKTGTVTEGRFTVTEVVAEGVSEFQLLTTAAAAERYSNHPIALCIRQAAEGIADDPAQVLQVEELPGRGVSAFINGHHVYVGNGALLEEHGIYFSVPSHPGTAIHVAIDNRYAGHIFIEDKIKDGALDAIEAVRAQGVDTLVMLTGDVQSVARSVSAKLGFDMVKSELMPDSKVSTVEYLLSTKNSGVTLGFVGDGVNDAPVLARADVGIAMGALGADAAIEAADVVLMDDDIRKLPLAMRIARFTMTIAKQNIIAALAVKFLILLLNIFGIANIWLAVFADVGVLILAIINSVRTLKKWKV